MTAAAAALQQGAAALQGIDYTQTQFSVVPLAPNVYALTGSPGADPGHPKAAGGRIGVLAGPDGAPIVDAQYAPLTDKVVAAILTVTPAPVRFLITAQEHPDHVGGNANVAHRGALIFAREEARTELVQPLPAAVAGAVGTDLLKALQAATGDAGDPLRLPLVTYGLGGQERLRLNGETVYVLAARSSHTACGVLPKRTATNLRLIVFGPRMR